MYYNTATDDAYIFANGVWVSLTAFLGDAITSVSDGVNTFSATGEDQLVLTSGNSIVTISINPLTGVATFGVNTASFDAQVHTNRLDQLAAPSNSVNFGGQRAIGLANGVSDSDAATVFQLNAALNGTDWKDSVRVATTAPISIATSLEEGDIIDGVTLVTGDRVLVKNQTNPVENGIYVVPTVGAAVRASDANGFGELSTGTSVFVEEGVTNSGLGFRISTPGGDLDAGVDPNVWVTFSGASSVVAGNGLIKTGNVVDVVAGNGLVALADSVEVVPDTTGGANLATAINVSSNGLAVKVDGATIGSNGLGQLLVSDDGITAAKLAPDTAGAGLMQNATTGALDVNVDGATIEIVSDQIRVVPGTFTKKVSTPLGDGIASLFAITHGLGTTNVIVQMRETAGGQEHVEVDWRIIDSNTIQIGSIHPIPSNNQYTVTIIG
jgi:hypothetical protein